jgi:hypothetical protein
MTRRAAVVSAPQTGKRVRQRRARAAVLAGFLLFVAIQLTTHRAIDSEVIPVRDPIYAEKVGLLKGHPEFWQKSSAPRGGRSSRRVAVTRWGWNEDPHTPNLSLTREEGSRILALGSSRTQLALDAERLSDEHCSVFNFGCAGCGPVATALYLRRLFEEGVWFDVALVELHPAMLSDRNPPFEANWLYEYRLRRHEPDTLREYGWRIHKPTQFRVHGPLESTCTFRIPLLNAYVPGLLPCRFGMTLTNRTDARGHVPGVPVPPAERWKHLANAYVEYHPVFENYRPGGPAAAAVKDVLTQLQQRGIRPVLLLTPESSEFRLWYGPGAQKEIIAFVTGLAKEFGVPLIDTREWIPDAEFADGHHCTPAGAMRFTERLRGVLR